MIWSRKQTQRPTTLSTTELEEMALRNAYRAASQIASLTPGEALKRAAALTPLREKPNCNLPACSRMGEIAIFHQIVRSLTSSLDLDTILGTILQHIEGLIQAEMWMLMLPDAVAGDMHCASAGGRNPEVSENLRGLRSSATDGLVGWVMQHGETLILPEAENDARMKDTTIRSVIAMPLRGRTSTLGVIQICNPSLNELPDETILFLHILADYAAIAIENAQDVSRIQQLTITDDVTGLYNARHLYAQLDARVAAGDNFALAMLDLDHFKQVNDRYGHLAGSEMLTRVAERIRQLSREEDLCFRYGGDEFVVLLPAASRAEAMRQMQLLNSALSATLFQLTASEQPNTHHHICSSIGISVFPDDGLTVQTVLAQADRRMYQVKSAGRGRVLAD